MALLTALAIGALAVSAASAASQYKQGQKAAKVQKEQSRIAQANAERERRMADIQNLRAQRSAIRMARQARAQIVSAGANLGTAGSSGVLGGASSVQAQLGSNLSDFTAQSQLQNEIFQGQKQQAVLQERLGSIQARSSMWGAVGQVAGSVFGATGGFGTVFGAAQAPQIPVQ